MDSDEEEAEKKESIATKSSAKKLDGKRITSQSPVKSVQNEIEK